MGSASPRQPPGDLFPVPRPLLLWPGSLPAVLIQDLAPRRTPRDELVHLGGLRCTLAGRQSGSMPQTFPPLVGRQVAAALRPSLPSGASVPIARAGTQPPCPSQSSGRPAMLAATVPVAPGRGRFMLSPEIDRAGLYLLRLALSCGEVWVYWMGRPARRGSPRITGTTGLFCVTRRVCPCLASSSVCPVGRTFSYFPTRLEVGSNTDVRRHHQP